MDKTLGFTRKSVKASGFLTRSEGAMGTRDCMERRSDFFESPAFSYAWPRMVSAVRLRFRPQSKDAL